MFKHWPYTSGRCRARMHQSSAHMCLSCLHGAHVCAHVRAWPVHARAAQTRCIGSFTLKHFEGNIIKIMESLFTMYLYWFYFCSLTKQTNKDIDELESSALLMMLPTAQGLCSSALRDFPFLCRIHIPMLCMRWLNCVNFYPVVIYYTLTTLTWTWTKRQNWSPNIFENDSPPLYNSSTTSFPIPNMFLSVFSKSKLLGHIPLYKFLPPTSAPRYWTY